MTSVASYPSFKARFADPNLDPFNGAYGSMLKEFATKATPEAASKAPRLFDKVQNTAGSQPHAFLVLTHGDAYPDPLITVMHTPFAFSFPWDQTQIQST